LAVVVEMEEERRRWKRWANVDGEEMNEMAKREKGAEMAV
jgi:hypothetical protein